MLKYLIMDHTTDDKVLIPAMKDLQEKYGDKIISASFDRGFWRPQNLIELKRIAKLACLPKKERRSKVDSAR